MQLASSASEPVLPSGVSMQLLQTINEAAGQSAKQTLHMLMTCMAEAVSALKASGRLVSLMLLLLGMLSFACEVLGPWHALCLPHACSPIQIQTLHDDWAISMTSQLDPGRADLLQQQQQLLLHVGTG